jgi:hypothetical protein
MTRKRNLIPRPEAAAYLSVKPQTLAVWATTGRYDLPFIKIGRKVFYDLEDLEQFMRNNTFTCTR